MNNIYFIAISLLILLYILNNVKKGKFSIEESLLWFGGSLIAIILSIFPKIFDKLANLLGIDYPPSLFFLLCIIFLLLINFRYSRKIAILNIKVIELAQREALLENEK